VARGARKVYSVGRRVQLVLLPKGKRVPWKRRLRTFVFVHQKAIGVAVVLSVSVVLVLIREKQLAAVTLASVADKAIELLGDLLTDRLFPGGEFVKPS
jgi:hypothetical protein